ncbi:MAG: zinc-dependent alcohol dehydrogenase [Acidimicrobiales bacterium]
MRAVVFDYADPAFPASVQEIEDPSLPTPSWARVAVSVGGICGSDLHLFSHNVGHSPALVPLAAFPFVLGHEIAGRVVEAGPDCPVPVGTRVAVDPCVPCAARGIDPSCGPCALGWASSCQNTGSKVLTPGMSLGFTMGLGGGWAEQVLAHPSMLHPLPDGVPDRAASLHEPTSIAVHGLLRQPPPEGAPVLVVGAGIIGLASVAALRHLFPASEVTVVARHDQQAAAATACGAHHVVRHAEDNAHFGELAELAGAGLSGIGDSTMLIGGFPYVVEAVGYPSSVTEALRAVDNRGTVLLLGAAGISEVDLTPVWWKEAALVGAVNHAVDPDPAGAPGGNGARGPRRAAPGPARHSVDRALDVLAAGLLPHEVVVTHEFGLDGLREAVAAAVDRKASGAIKVVFRPNGSNGGVE